MVAPSDVHVQTAGAWKESELGSRSRRPAATVSWQSVSNDAEPETAERHMADRD
ncbi:MAG: hypothetical protein WAN86_00670 [Hyphomicrobiaceae bacterium]